MTQAVLAGPRARLLAGATILVLSLAACGGHRGQTAAGGRTSAGPSAATSQSPQPSPSGVASSSTTSGRTGASSAVASGSTGAAAGFPTTTISKSGGAEGVEPSEGPVCKITSTESVAHAFGGSLKVIKIGVSGLGQPICTYSVVTAQFGGSPAVVTMVLNRSASLADYRANQAAHPHAVLLRLRADDAFYDGESSTLELIKGRAVVIMQVLLNSSAGTKYAAAIKAGLVSIGSTAAAQL